MTIDPGTASNPAGFIRRKAALNALNQRKPALRESTFLIYFSLLCAALRAGCAVWKPPQPEKRNRTRVLYDYKFFMTMQRLKQYSASRKPDHETMFRAADHPLLPMRNSETECMAWFVQNENRVIVTSRATRDQTLRRFVT